VAVSATSTPRWLLVNSLITGAALVAAQLLGGFGGAVLANLMFDLSAVSIAGHDRTGRGLWLGEVVAALGLVLVIFGSIRAGRTHTLAYAVASYITAAYWFTSSTSFANPPSPLREYSPTPSPASLLHLGCSPTTRSAGLLALAAGQSQTSEVTSRCSTISTWLNQTGRSLCSIRYSRSPF
jgi:hypothetical protein